MFHRFHDRFGTAGVVIAVIALIAALGGTALAAGGLSGKQKKEVEKIAKKFQGTGPAGAAGANGTNGTPGAKGDKGDTGTNGKSVLTTNITSAGLEGKCVGLGGTRFEVEGSGVKSYTCNGEEGPEGPEGPEGVCSTSSCHLPANVTETGTWVWTGENEAGSELLKEHNSSVPVSFNIPVKPAPTFVYVPGSKTGFGSNAAAGCPGVTAGNIPQAGTGKFCVYSLGYEAGLEEIPPATVETVSPAEGPVNPGTVVTPAGTILYLTCPTGGTFEVCTAHGLWAVTG